MGTVTVSLDNEAYSPIDANGGYMIRLSWTMSTSYATGGDLLPVTAIGAGQMRKILIDNIDSTAATDQAYAIEARIQPGGTSALVRAFYDSGVANTPFNEVIAGTNLSLVNVRGTIFAQ